MKRERRQTNDNEKGNGPRVCEVPVATNPLAKVLSSWLLICFDASSPRVSLSVCPMVYVSARPRPVPAYRSNRSHSRYAISLSWPPTRVKVGQGICAHGTLAGCAARWAVEFAACADE
jgi:hypothetical protein